MWLIFEILDAIASIIGTVTNKDAENIAVKEEPHEVKNEIKKEVPDIEEHENLKEQEEIVDSKKCDEDNTQPSDTKIDDQGEIRDSQVSLTNDENKNDHDHEKEKDLILTDEDTQSAKMSDGEFDNDDDDITVPVDPDAKLSDDMDAKNNSDPVSHIKL